MRCFDCNHALNLFISFRQRDAEVAGEQLKYMALLLSLCGSTVKTTRLVGFRVVEAEGEVIERIVCDLQLIFFFF